MRLGIFEKRGKRFTNVLVIVFLISIVSTSVFAITWNFESVKSLFSEDTQKPASTTSFSPSTGRSGGDEFFTGTGRGGTAPDSGSGRGGTSFAPTEQYNNLENILPQSEFVQDLPKGSTVWLRFYNFNTGERQWENSYVLKKGSVVKGDTADADLIIFISSKYLSQITKENFCEIAKKSNENGDFGVDTSLSELSLAWKFKSMMKYKDCLGV